MKNGSLSLDIPLQIGDVLYTTIAGTTDYTRHVIVEVTETQAVTGGRMRLPRVAKSTPKGHCIAVIPFNARNRIPITFWLETPDHVKIYERHRTMDTARMLLNEVHNINNDVVNFTDRELQLLINALEDILKIRQI